MTKWVDEQLKAALKGITFTVPAGAGGVITTTQVGAVSGDASISVSRGKRRHLLDVTFDVEFEGKVGDSTGKGKLSYSEVTTGDDEPEVKMEVNSDSAPELREVFNAFVKPAGQGLQPLILKELNKVIEEYKAK